jgi:hypothetical protein
MQTITQITQPQPCHEPWANMNTIENGRFCNSCNKAVIDFTTMTNQQIIDYLSASTGNTCGRISASQFSEVNIQLSKPAPINAGFWKRMILTATMLASLTYVKGQTGEPKARTEQTQDNLVTGKVIAIADPIKYITLTGVVTDNQGKPLQQATVTAGKQSALTNASGTFRLKVPEDINTFQVKIIGWETKTVKINKNTGKPYKVIVLPSMVYLGGLGAIKRPGVVKAFYQAYIINPVTAFFG